MPTEIICDRDNMVTVNGVPYYKELIKPAEKKETGYEVENGEKYFFYDSCFDIVAGVNSSGYDKQRIECGMALKNEEFTKMIARHDKLWLKIRKWQALNDEPVDVRNSDEIKYYIAFSSNNSVYVGWFACRTSNVVLFSSEEKAQECIDVFREELQWDAKYYKPRMDAE